jgi:drug/metabolite transporter (DMT)-like permease
LTPRRERTALDQGRLSEANRSADLILLTAFALWSLNFAVVKVGLREFQPLAFAFLRFGIAGIVLLGVLHRQERRVGVERKDLPLLALIGLLGIAASQVALVFALTRTTAVNAALLNAAGPLVVVVLASLLGVESLRRRHWASVLIGLVGVALIVGVFSPSPLSGTDPGGDLMILVYVVTSSVPAVLYPRLLPRYTVLRVLTYEILLGTAMLLPIALPSLAAQDYGVITSSGLEALGYAALCTGVVANLLYFSAVGRVGPSLATIFQYLQSFLGAMFGVVLLGESLTFVQILGGVIIVGSIILSRSASAAPAQAPEGIDGPHHSRRASEPHTSAVPELAPEPHRKDTSTC